jgi:hypothetical protein
MGVSGNDMRSSERNSGRQGRMRPAIKGTATMRIRLDSVTPMSVAGTAAACPDVRQVIPPALNVGRHDPRNRQAE